MKTESYQPIVDNTKFHPPEPENIYSIFIRFNNNKEPEKVIQQLKVVIPEIFRRKQLICGKYEILPNGFVVGRNGIDFVEEKLTIQIKYKLKK